MPNLRKAQQIDWDSVRYVFLFGWYKAIPNRAKVTKRKSSVTTSRAIPTGVSKRDDISTSKYITMQTD